MTSGMSFEFDGRNHTVVVLLVLRATLVLPLARVPLSLLQQGAKVVLPNCASHLVQSQLWDSYQPALSKMVLKRDCAAQQSDVARL